MGTTALELAVLAHLEHGDLICAQLARRTGASESAVQRLLDDLVSDGLVTALPDDREPTSHHLTHRGAARLLRLRTFSEQQAANDWKQQAPPVHEGETRQTWASADPRRAALEHALLRELEHGRRTRDELMAHVRTSPGVLRPALEALLAWECVSVRHHDNLPDTYHLTAVGRSRIQFVRSMLATPDGRAGKLRFVALQQLPPPSPPEPPRPVDEVPRRRWFHSWMPRNR
ncbi:MarR family transcriptional regulator [Kribbella sp. NPDC051587]|uniref:MarR family transcriptional regulator n=1 Tax=Kribbella sp. NPDC051587 TaxID=3364119 RepID=UPI00378FD398